MHSALAVVVKKSRKKFQDLAAANYETNWKLAADTKSKMQKNGGGENGKYVGNEFGGRLYISKLAAAQ